MKRPTFQRIGVVANLQKEGVVQILNEFVPQLIDAGFDVFADEDTAQQLTSPVGIERGIPKDCDLLAAIGGDGTMLMVARRYLDLNIPLLGVKGGRLGFLTEPPGLETVARIKSGAFVIQERMRIDAAVEENGKVIKEFSALNDVVVHVAGSSRIVGLRTHVDSTLIREYFADGVIVATPTGSTAYSLSAGGPVVMPTVRAMMLTPLAPHTLSVRPLVIDAEGTVRVEILSPNTEMRITVDGQKGMDLRQGQQVVVRRSPEITRLVVPEDYDFFSLLREKL